MQVSKLLVTNLCITEDEYNFRGSFVLSDSVNSFDADISDLEDSNKLKSIKDFFNLEEEDSEIRNYIMTQVIDKASISSRITEGESYQETSNETDKSVSCLDLS